MLARPCQSLAFEQMAAARSSSATEHNETPVPGLASCRLRPTASQGLGDMTEFCYVEDSAANVGADCPVGAAWVLESAPALSGPRLFVELRRLEVAVILCLYSRPM